jgi:HlyD family secretion protein
MPYCWITPIKKPLNGVCIMSKKKIIWISIVAILIVLIVVLSAMKGKDSNTVKVQTDNVKKQEIIATVASTGIIQPETQVKISADVSAKIIKMDVKEGDWVEKGQFLAQLDREKYLAAVESSEANLRSSRANANLARENMQRAEKDYKRVKELFEKQLESQAIMDQNSANYQVEKARYQSVLEQVDQAGAILKQAKDDLSKTTITAPMAGTISQLNKEMGEIALGSQFQEDVIMVISDLNNMEALVDVDENDIVSIALGDKAKVEVDALSDLEFDGMVTEIASSAKVSGSGTADQKTEFEVKVKITNPGEKLRPGMTASAEIVTEVRDNVLVVPIQSVSVRSAEELKNHKPEGNSGKDSTENKTEYTPDKDGFVAIVWVVNDGIVKAIPVKTGIQSETHIEIVNGLAENDEVVTGNYRAISQILQNNTKVEVEPKGGSPDKALATQ